MKKRKQKRFTKQFELDAEIIKLRRLAERKDAKAKLFDKSFHDYDLLATDPDSPPHLCQFNAERAALFKKKAVTLREQINGIYMRRIPSLVLKKAELATKVLPGFDENMGVAA
jgi:hypothetical protein